MSSRKRNQVDRLDPFSEKTDLEQVADEIFGASPAPELNTGRVVARPTPIDEIWADVRQPRRAIPASVRLVWNGSPADVPQLLQNWGAVAANAAGRTIDIQKIITGDGDGVETDGTPPIYESFISLLRLAGSILRDGLINPISIVDQRDRHLIESGERRWLAYWLLRLHALDGDKFSRIPSVTASGADFVWRQAAENTARRSLNAVGMARQLALLIMSARGEDQYHDYDQIVPPGGSDRRYYAQIADGNVHRIPKGAGERIQGAMGLSMHQLAQYRRLLRVTDDEEINDLLWLRADIEDWAEGAFRDVYTLTVVKVREILSRDGWSYNDFRAAASTPPRYAVERGSGGEVPPSSPSLSVGTRQVVSSPGGEDSDESRRVLSDIRQGFARVYAIEDSPDHDEQLAATRATRLLNQAQTFYERDRLESAQESLTEAFHLLDEAATAADSAPLLVQRGGDGGGDAPVGAHRDAPSAAGGSPRMSAYEMQELVRWAWRWGKGHFEGGGWFTPQDCPQASPGHLAKMVMEGYLWQGTAQRGKHEIVSYRITSKGCRFLGVGFDVINWDAREQPPRTEGEGVGGEGSLGSSSDNPPSDGSKSEPLIDRAAPIFKLLAGLQTLAQITGQQGALETTAALLNMTWGEAIELATQGQLNDVLQLHFDNINNALSAWSMDFGKFLEDLTEQLSE